MKTPSEQITPYAKEIIDYVCSHGRMGELASQMFLDDCLAPNWRQMIAPPEVNEVISGIFKAEDEEGDDA